MKTDNSTEEQLFREIDRIIGEISENVIDELSNNNMAVNRTMSDKSDYQVTIFDIYQNLKDISIQIEGTINRFRLSLDKSKNSEMINKAIHRLVVDFYNLRDVFREHTAHYNKVNFTNSEEAKVAKLYIDKCLKEMDSDRDTCLVNLIKETMKK